jgi:hypothetical protein
MSEKFCSKVSCTLIGCSQRKRDYQILTLREEKYFWWKFVSTLEQFCKRSLIWLKYHLQHHWDYLVIDWNQILAETEIIEVSVSMKRNQHRSQKFPISNSFFVSNIIETSIELKRNSNDLQLWSNKGQSVRHNCEIYFWIHFFLIFTFVWKKEKKKRTWIERKNELVFRESC